MPFKKIQDVVETNCSVHGGTSRSAISRAIRSKFLCGPVSWKRTSTRHIENVPLKILTIVKTF